MPKATRRNAANGLYQDDLAHIHVEGYDFHWIGASKALLDMLEHSNLPGRTVVDLGCGGGQWLETMQTAGYQVWGVDVSAAMLEIAAQRVPRSNLILSSSADVEIPSCAAVTSLGEPINYLPSAGAIRRTFRNVFKALQPGGIFVFDCRHPASKPVPPRDHHRLGDNWFCYAHIEEDYQTGKLTRNIASFRQLPNGDYRRQEEIHRLRVFSRHEMMQWLRQIGFRVQTRRGYGDFQLGPRQSVFICRKP